MNQKLYALPKKLGVVLLFLLFAGLSSLMAQKTITGKVSDAAGPIPGANVVIKGTTTGTATDGDGNYSLALKGDNLTLVISAVGYTAQEIAVGTQTSIDVTLAEDVSTLQEVVVTGYGVDGTRRQTTGAVSTVKPRELKAVPSGNVEQQLQGRVAGLTVITNGQPGTSSIIRVRGFGSFGGNEPLIIIDGTPTGSTDFLAPDDIESVTVLKDAATASIYGARAAGGVIVYTTKRGSRKSKKMQVSYDGLYGSTDPGKGQAMMNPTDFMAWTWQGEKNTAAANGTTLDAAPIDHPQFGKLTESFKGKLPTYLKVGGTNGAAITSVNLDAERLKYNVNPNAGSVYQVIPASAGTDWYAAITRQAPIQRHSLGFSGGSESSQYYLGLSVQDQKGILIGNGYKRYTFRANSEFDLTKNLRIGENLQFTYISVVGQTGGSGGRGVNQDENDILQAFRMPSIIPVYDAYGGYGGTTAAGFNNPRNPVANRDGQKDNYNFNTVGFGNIYAELDVIPGLKLRSNVGGRMVNYYYKGYSRLQYENSENNASYGFSEGAGNNLAWSLTNTASYSKKIGDHQFDVLAGLESLNTGRGRNIDGSGINPFSTDPNYITLGNVNSSGKNVTSNIAETVNFFSTFGRLNYYFKGYSVTGILRRDASSRFGANSRTGVFPAVAAAWRLTDESFMKNQAIFQDLKVRVGWGKMGNSNNVNPNNQYSLFGGGVGSSSYDITGSNSSVQTGFFRTRIGNPDARWETAITSNIGLDATLLKGSLDFTVELWRKQTEGLLFSLPLPAVVGPSASAPAVNIANMVNEGIDLSLTKRGKIIGDLKYEAIFNGGFLRNEITSLAPESNVTFFEPFGLRGITPIRNQVGKSISAFFGYKMIGYFNTAAEVTSAPKQEGAGVGRFKFEDNNGYDSKGQLTGVPDGKIDAADRTYIGSPVPKFTGGLTLNLTYKNFDVSAYLYSSIGNKIFNMSKWYTDFYGTFKGAAISERIKESWTPTNTNPIAPIFEQAANTSTAGASNSWYVEDGSYLRLQFISIGYTLPSDLLKKAGVGRARISANINNLFTITKYQGLDPGVGGAADQNFGIDVGNYPLTRSFNLGLSVGF